MRIVTLMCVAALTLQAEAHAQIVLDGSVGPAGALAGPDYAVGANLGTQIGVNLFHSFSAFNVLSGESATFSGEGAIDNIISRVTGGTASTIDGLLRSTIASADFYLVNPNGILFGANASLDVDGSFHASTADHVRFSDGKLFSASSPSGNTLSVAAPEAFGFLGASPASITVTDSILRVGDKQTLSLVGGNLTITGGPTGLIDAPGGQINLISVASPGEVILGDGQVEVTSAALGDISLSDLALIQAEGFNSSDGTSGDIVIRGGGITVDGATISTDQGGANRGGNISITGDTVVLTNAAAIQAGTFGAGLGGEIIVTASESVTIERSTTLFSDAFDFGDGGRVAITAPLVTILSSGRIDSSTSGFARAGNVEITASDTVLLDFGDIFSDTLGGSSGGDIIISAPRLILRNQSFITSESLGDPGDTGSAGTVTLNVGSLAMSGASRIDTKTKTAGRAGDVTVTASGSVSLDGSRIFSDTTGAGAAGVVSITTGQLELTGGSSVTSEAFDDGDAGSVILDVASLVMDASRITTSGSLFPALGAGGNVTITASASMLLDGSDIFSDSFGDGPAGVVSIKAGQLVLTGGSFVSSEAFGVGDAGSVILDVASLVMREASIISTDGSSSIGAGGDVTIMASDSVLLDSSDIFSDTAGDGDGGDIIISTPSLTLRNVSAITAESDGFSADIGNAGTVTFDVGSLTISGLSKIDTTTSTAGRAGAITITATDSMSLDFSDIFSDTFGTGSAGVVSINAGQLNLTDRSTITSDTLGAGSAGVVSIKAGLLTMTASSSVSSEAFDQGDAGSVILEVGNLVMTDSATITTSGSESPSTGAGGDVTVTATGSVSLDASNIFSDTFGNGDGGDITISAPSLTLQNASAITAETIGTSENTGNAGTVTLVVANLTMTGVSKIDTTTQTTGQAGAITITVSGSLLLDNSTILSSTSGVGVILTDPVVFDPNSPADFFFTTLESGNPLTAGEVDSLVITSLQLPGLTAAIPFIAAFDNSVGAETPDLVARSINESGTEQSFDDDSSVLGSGLAPQLAGIANADGSIRLQLSGFPDTGFTGDHSQSGDYAVSVVIGVITGDTVFVPGGSGGSVNINAYNLLITNGGRIEAVSTGTGRAGDISIASGYRVRLDNSAVTSQALNADGGDIVFDVATLLQLTNSQITTSVGSGGGNGGNITIDPIFVVLLSSTISANAFGGNGGNIVIVADNFFATPDSVIEASSNLGIEGSIEIDSPDTDVSGGLIVLSSSFLDAGALMADRCAARIGLAASSLTGVGRGGLPLAPDGPVPSFYLARAGATTDQMARAASGGLAPASGIIPGTLVLACGQ